MMVRKQTAGRPVSVSLLVLALVLPFAFTGTAVAEGQWWTSDPATEDAKKRLYRVKGIRSVFFHRDSAGTYQPHLVVDRREFSLAQQRAACEIIWRKYGISAFYEFQGHLEEDQMVLPLDCATEYPELSPAS